MPLEPWGNISGDVVEADLKQRCEKNTLVEVRSSWAVINASETDSGLEIKVVDPAGRERSLKGGYAVGCEGASIVVRKASVSIRWEARCDHQPES